jgi:enoyl-CoA hydratase/carnithine racemase
MRFAARETAVLGQPEIGVGLLPGVGGTVRLTQLLGRGRALEVCLGGEDFDADTAALYGWVNRALPGDQLGGFCDALARRVAGFPSRGIGNVKALVERVSRPDEDALADESQRFIADMHGQETVDRVRWMLAQGGQTQGAMELELGELIGRYPRPIDA